MVGVEEVAAWVCLEHLVPHEFLAWEGSAGQEDARSPWQCVLKWARQEHELLWYLESWARKIAYRPRAAVLSSVDLAIPHPHLARRHRLA